MIANSALFELGDWQPLIDPSLITLLACAAIAGAIIAARLGGASAARFLHVLRMGAIAGLAVILMNPSRLAHAPAPERPSLTILMDTSASMSIPDVSTGDGVQTRWGAIRSRWLTPRYLDRLNRSADVRMLAFSDRAAAVAAPAIPRLEPTGIATRLTDAMEAAMLALRPAEEGETSNSGARRILLLSDAIDTTGRDPRSLISLAHSQRTRIDVVVPISAQGATPPADIAITATPRRHLVQRGEAASIDLEIKQTGFDGQPVTLTLRQLSPVDRVLAQRTVILGSESASSIDVTPMLPADAERGLHAVECVAAIEALDSEIEVSNNADPFFLQVTDARIRVAVFEGEPSWDSRFFVAALANDLRFEITVVHALGRRPGAVDAQETIRTRRITPGVARSIEESGLPAPVSQEALDRFDIIALGRRIEALFPGDEAVKLARFVTERSGALVLLRGDPISDSDGSSARDARRALASVIPVQFTANNTRPAIPTALFAYPDGARALGHVAPALDEAPEVAALVRVAELSPLAAVWLGGFDDQGPAPALLHAPVGSGRILINLADGLWRWSMLPPDRSAWRASLGSFWPQLMGVLALDADWAPGQDASLALDRAVAAPGEQVTIVARARGPLANALRPEVTIEGVTMRESSPRALAPTSQSGRWIGTFTPEMAGVATVTMRTGAGDSLKAHVNVREDNLEMARTFPDSASAAAIAKATGGEVLTIDSPDQYAQIIETEATAAIAGTTLEPAWRRPWVFCVIVALLGIEWFWRRRIGLP